MASTPEQVVCTPTFVFPAAFPGSTNFQKATVVRHNKTDEHIESLCQNTMWETFSGGGDVGTRMKGHRTVQPELSDGRPILMPHLAACHLSTWQGFDPRPHLANFHPIAGATPPPPPLQHPEDQKTKVANRTAGVKPQSQATNNDFSAVRNLAPVVPTSVAYSVDAGKIPSGNIEKQEPEALKDKLWPCPSCKVPFKAASELQAHLSAHTKGEKTVPCEICGKLFASIERVRIHIRAAHGEKSCSCDICGSGFSYRCKLLDHMRTHTGDKPFHCDICGKSFSQKNHLTRHSMIHTGERPYPCDFCGRGFYRKDKLTRHRRIHTGEKPYACLACGKAFYRRDKLTRHIKMHSGEKPFACGICGKRFIEERDLKRHKCSSRHLHNSSGSKHNTAQQSSGTRRNQPQQQQQQHHNQQSHQHHQQLQSHHQQQQPHHHQQQQQAQPQPQHHQSQSQQQQPQPQPQPQPPPFQNISLQT